VEERSVKKGGGLTTGRGRAHSRIAKHGEIRTKVFHRRRKRGIDVQRSLTVARRKSLGFQFKTGHRGRREKRKKQGSGFLGRKLTKKKKKSDLCTQNDRTFSRRGKTSGRRPQTSIGGGKSAFLEKRQRPPKKVGKRKGGGTSRTGN